MANEKRLIYAEDLLKPVNYSVLLLQSGGRNSGKTMAMYEKFFRKRVEMAPTVDAVEVVHGEWLDGYAVDHNGKKVYDSIDCSVCEEVFKIESHDREYWKGRLKRCYCCGAVMDGGHEYD